MKKCVLIIAILCLAFPLSARAEFKDQLAQDVGKLLGEFFQAEQGNKLTGYSMDGLLIRMNRVLTENKVAPAPAPPKGLKTQETPRPVPLRVPDPPLTPNPTRPDELPPTIPK